MQASWDTTTVRTKIGGLMLAGLALLPAVQADLPVSPTNNASILPHGDATLTEIHQEALDDLAAKRQEFKAAKVLIPSVHQALLQALTQVRSCELAMSSTKEQQIAAHARHVACLRELEDEAPTDRVKLVVKKMREAAEAELVHIKGREISSADLERDQGRYRSAVINNWHRAKERQRRATLVAKKRSRSAFVYPTFPPRLAD